MACSIVFFKRLRADPLILCPTNASSVFSSFFRNCTSASSATDSVPIDPSSSSAGVPKAGRSHSLIELGSTRDRFIEESKPITKYTCAGAYPLYNVEYELFPRPSVSEIVIDADMP